MSHTESNPSWTLNLTTGNTVGWLDVGGDPLHVKTLERKYHSVVRAKKQRWLLTRLQRVVQDLHSNRRSFWQVLWGPPRPLPGPLGNPQAWNDYLSALCWPLSLSPGDVTPLDICLVLSAEPAAHLSEPFSLVEVEL
jgi:hypothetical protein